MKNKKWISLAAAVVLAVTALPMGVFAAKKDGEEEKLTKVTLNEVAHSIFYAPQYVAIEEGYFAEEGLDLTLVTGFGADKVLTALISGEADIGFMGAEASIYAYQEGATDPAVNFAQLTQRAGNFLVAREEMPDFKWEDLKGKKVLGGTFFTKNFGESTGVNTCDTRYIMFFKKMLDRIHASEVAWDTG